MKSTQFTKSTKAKGFTLLELMIVVSLMSLVMLIIFLLFSSMLRSTRTIDAKVKMRDEARTGLNHVARNLRMADSRNAGVLLYETANGVVVDMSEGTLVEGDIFDNITFRRPIDADNDGTPFIADTMTVEWSDPVTITLDRDDANEDGDIWQLVQLDEDGDFTRLLVDDISPVVNSGTGGDYDTSSLGGAFFTIIDAKTLQITLIQRRQLESGMGTIVTRYDDYVSIRN